MAATITTLNAILKEFYLAPIQEQLNQEVLVLELMEKAVVDWAGRRVVIPLHTARNTGVAFGGSTAALPIAGQETYVRAEVEAKFLYGRFEITGPAISSLAKGGTASFAGYVEAEMDKLVEDVRTKANRVAFCGGDVIGVLNERDTKAKASTWEFTGDIQKVAALKAAAVVANGGGAPVLVASVHTSFTGDFGNSQGGYETIATGIEVDVVAGVSVPNSTLLLGTALDTTKTTSGLTIPQGFGAVVVITGALKAAGGAALVVPEILALANEPIGIYGNLGSQTHFTLPRFFTAVGPVDNNPIIRSTIITQNNLLTQTRAALSLGRIQAVFDNVMEISGQEPNYIIMNPTQRQRYVALLQGQIAGAGLMSDAGKGSKIADGGYVGLSYGNVPIKVSKDAPKGGLCFLKLDTWKLCELEKGDFADLDGAVISRVPGFDSYEGYYRFYYNTISVRPNANALLVGCSL
jgi:hypothetical protein